MYWEVKVGPTLPPVLESRTEELLNGPAKKKNAFQCKEGIQS